MRLSEIITIYLAAAAPVGVIYFLRSQMNAERHARALVRATGAALIWPLTLLAFRLEHFGRRGARRASVEAESDRPDEGKAERVKRTLLAALCRVEDLSEQYEQSQPETEGETMRQALFCARSSVERYVGLALAAAGTDARAEASARELELPRIAGRAGDDLRLAGRCIHRRNVRRLLEHHERARAELLHALADLREASPLRLSEIETGATANADADLRLSEAILQAYACAVELLSTLEDRRAAMSVARLLDAECARLRRVESSNSRHAHARPAGGETCTTRPEPHSQLNARHTPALPRLPQTTPTSTRA